MKYTYTLITIIASLTILTQSGFVKLYPDAIRCGEGNNPGAIYFVHAATQGKGAWYCQVYDAQNRCVNFNSDGAYVSGTGHEESRSGCAGKTFKQLKKQKRTFELVNNDEEIAELRARVEKLEAKQGSSKYDQSLIHSRTIETILYKYPAAGSSNNNGGSLQKEP